MLRISRDRAMRWQTVLQCVGITLTGACLMGAFASGWGQGDEKTQQVARGDWLFAHEWQTVDAQTPTGDGLGPLFNATSCAACHRRGGVGGSGGDEGNVDVLTVIPPQNRSVDRAKIAEQVKAIHPNLVVNGAVRPSITLHKFGTAPGYATWQGLLLRYLDRLPQERGPNEFGLVLTHRRAPSLRGSGLIDAIPDKVLRAIAAEQAQRDAAPRGRVAVSSDGRIGKFGWRGQTATLKQFVMGACANELGLSAPSNDQALDPLNPKSRSTTDLTQQQCDDLAAFVAGLPAPAQLPTVTAASQERRSEGWAVFRRIGCAECHRAKVGDVVGIYSDLLLHDMGEELADPVPANSPGRGASGSAPYYGGPADLFVEVTPEMKRLWRTPPLWGVVGSAPYLHDGRAATLHDAIVKHGGEATAARQDYGKLSSAQRDQLLLFLESTGQPPSLPGK